MFDELTKILLIEDNPAHTRLVREMCVDCQAIDLNIVSESTLASGLAHLRKGDIRAVLLDLNLPDSQGLETLSQVNDEFPETPIIVLTGQEDENIAVEALKQGAQDYLVKGVVGGNQLVRSIRYAIERKRMEISLVEAKNNLERRVQERTRELEKQVTERKMAADELEKSEERFRAIFEGARDCVFIKDLALKYTHVNPAMAKLFDLQVTEMLGKTAEDFLRTESAQTVREADIRVLRGESIEEITTREIRGISMIFHEIKVPMHDRSGKIIGICGISRDVTDLNRVQETREFAPQEYNADIMKDVLKQAAFAASSKSIVLLVGESGVGKDHLAKYIHKQSHYSSGSYFSINCAAVPLELAESELFGHEAGAFTGAARRKKGLLELAEGGTLLLNEIGELSPALQAKFLTFLDTKTFTRVGGQQKIKVNARILAATNKDLQQEMSVGHFRADLYYRLNVLTIRIPPLRERIEDLPILVKDLLSTLAKELQMTFSEELPPNEMAKLYNYRWPGNIRELRNVLERAVILSGGGNIKVDIDAPSIAAVRTSFPEVPDLAKPSILANSMENLNRSMIEQALKRFNGRRELAASYLGISRYTLRRRMKKLSIDVRK
ncbi:MAG: sigma 54-interacting transcriptional regulator [Desulfomonilaceae bacterium]